MEKKPLLIIKGINKSYHNQTVLNGVNLTIYKGEFISIVGKSGCGKSTLLRIIAGLEPVNSGDIFISTVRLTGINKEARMMFQDGRLLPWKTIMQNIGLGLTGDWKGKVSEALKHVGLEDRASDYPASLSGGQKQRVALARALVHEPSLLLLDEPLGALDALTRMEMQLLIENIWRQKMLTSLLVTHDVEEAVLLSDRVIILENGQIALNKEIDLPRPRNRSHPSFNSYLDEILGYILRGSVEKGNVRHIG